MNTDHYSQALWDALCEVCDAGCELSLENSMLILATFSCEHCSSSGDDCQGCPLKIADEKVTSDLWQRAENEKKHIKI